MKKMLVLALATIAFTAQANAGAERDRDGKNDTRKVEQSLDRAGRGGKVDGVDHTIKSLETSNLMSGLSGESSAKLQIALKDGRYSALQAAAAEIVASNKPANQELNSERVEGLANLAHLNPALFKKDSNSAIPEEKAQEAYAALVLNAGSQAEGKNAMSAEVSKTLRIANQELRRGKSFDAAMTEALTELKKVTKSEKSIAQLMEDLKNLCNERRG